MSGDIHRLEGSNSQMQGGLIIKKKKTDNDDSNKFLQPKLPHMEKKSKLGRVSVQGVESLWGDCRFIPADWGS